MDENQDSKFNKDYHNEENNDYENDRQYYDDTFYKNVKRRQRRLDELAEREAILRKEKQRLLLEKPWFKKPQNIIAIFAVLLPIVVSILFTVYKEDVKELTIYQSEIEPLIIDSERIRTNVIIKQDSSEITNIYKISFTLENSGNITLDKSDFSDGPINLIMDYNNSNLESNIIEVFKRDDANQQNSILELKSERNRDIIQYLPSLLNKGDQVVIDIYLLSNTNLEIKAIGKIKEGKVIGPLKRAKNEIRYGYKTFVYSISSMFPQKWIAICFFIVLFIFSALTTLFQVAMLVDKELNPKLLGYLMIITSGFLTLLSMAILITIISIT